MSAFCGVGGFSSVGDDAGGEGWGGAKLPLRDFDRTKCSKSGTYGSGSKGSASGALTPGDFGLVIATVGVNPNVVCVGDGVSIIVWSPS